MWVSFIDPICGHSLVVFKWVSLNFLSKARVILEQMERLTPFFDAKMFLANLKKKTRHWSGVQYFAKSPRFTELVPMEKSKFSCTGYVRFSVCCSFCMNPIDTTPLDPPPALLKNFISACRRYDSSLESDSC